MSRIGTVAMFALTFVLGVVTTASTSLAGPSPAPYDEAQAAKIKGNVEATGGKFTDIADALTKILGQVIPTAVYTSDSLREKNDLQELATRLVSLKLAQIALRNSVELFVEKRDAASWGAVLGRAENSFKQNYSLTNDLQTGHLTFFELSPTLKENLISALTAREMVQMQLGDKPPSNAELSLVRSLPRLPQHWLCMVGITPTPANPAFKWHRTRRKNTATD